MRGLPAHTAYVVRVPPCHWRSLSAAQKRGQGRDIGAFPFFFFSSSSLSVRTGARVLPLLHNRSASNVWLASKLVQGRHGRKGLCERAEGSATGGREGRRGAQPHWREEDVGVPGEELAGVRVRQACIVTPKVCSFSLSQASSCAHKKTNRDFTLASLVEANPDVIICSDPAGFVSQGTDVILLLSSLALTTNTGHHTNTPSKKWTTLLSTLRTARANTFWEHTRRSTTRKGTRHSPTSTTTGSLPDCLALTPRSATQPRSSVHSPNTLPRFVVAAHQQSTQQAITNVIKTGRIQRL